MADSNAPNTASKARKSKANGGEDTRPTFMLHDPQNFSSLGKYQSADYRYAALKAASKGHTQILLRKTNTKEIREFSGKVEKLDVPKVIKRGGREIKYERKPLVKYVQKFVLQGLPSALDDEPLADVPAAAS
jgi:hypothetical protein